MKVSPQAGRREALMHVEEVEEEEGVVEETEAEAEDGLYLSGFKPSFKSRLS